MMDLAQRKAKLEKQKALLEKQLKNIENSAAYRKELELEKALDKFVKVHRTNKKVLVNLLLKRDDSARKLRSKSASSPKKRRKPRKLKIYKNPNTGDVVETRGGNHKILKAWKSDYALRDIAEWLIETKP
tara:strand:- start:1816 stop:2205 length:390 start_codon:yes stop_codon:yes gene_type:complete